MERLTERFNNGQAAVMGCGENCKYDYKYCRNHYEECPEINKIYERLAEYEDTGLTPAEIMELKERDTAMEINEILAEQRITAIKAWKSIKDDGLPPVGSCLIVTIKNHGYGGRRELRYPVHYLEKYYAPGYAFYMNGTDILLPEYSEVVAWMHVPTPYEGE